MTQNQIIMRAMTLSVLASLGWLSACSSDSSKTAGTGGASNAGGTTGIGGAPSTGGGSSGGHAGTTGGNGGTASRDCTASNTETAPTDGLIATFTDADAGIDIVGGKLIAYPVGSASAPIVTTMNGMLHIALNAPATTESQYPGVAIGSVTHCIDASAYSGVEFSISGSFAGCTMQYAAGDVAHQDATTRAPLATGPMGSYQPQTSIAASQVTSTVQTLRMPFSGQSAGNPSTPLDKGKLILVLWQFTVNPAVGTTTSACIADITIDNVKFY